MKPISVRFFFPYLVMMAPGPYHELLAGVVADWNNGREKNGEKRVLSRVVVGSMELPRHRDDKGALVTMFAEFFGNVGYDHGSIFQDPEAARDELNIIAAAFNTKLAEKSLLRVTSSEITAGFCVWVRDEQGALGQMKDAA